MLSVSNDLGKVIFDALSIGQLIDGGNFIHLGAGIIHGWDPSITESIF